MDVIEIALDPNPTIPQDWHKVVRAGGTHTDGTHGVDLIELLDVGEAGDLGLLVITALEHLV